MWHNIKDKLMEVRSKFVPQSNTAASSWKSKYKYPLNSETREAIKEKNRLHRKWISFHQTERTPQAWIDYAKARNKVNTLVRKDKRKYEQGIAKEGKLKPKLFWSHARRKLKTKVSVAPLLANVDDKSSLVFDDKEKANLLQNQFTKVFTKEPLHNIPSFRMRSQTKIRTIEIPG